MAFFSDSGSYLSSGFGSGGFGSLPNWNSTDAFKLPDTFKFSSGTKTGGEAVGPLALATLGSSLISGLFGGMAANRQAEAEMQVGKWQAEATRDAAFANLLAGQYGATGAKAYGYKLQRDAADYQQSYLDPKASILGQEDRLRGITTDLSPQAQKLRRQQNIDALNTQLASRRAITDAMFGRVKEDPWSYGGMPGYASSFVG